MRNMTRATAGRAGGVARRIAAIAILGCLACAPAAGATEVLRPLRAAAPPVIDGDLSDRVWRDAPGVTGFKTWTPDFGRDLVGPTTVYLAYDADNLYFAFRCHDLEPGGIKYSVTARDRITPDDWVCVHLDTFNDHQAQYAFYVNPLGIQMDARDAIGVEGDCSVDLVWFSDGRVDEDGYVVEMQIPLRSIRFREDEPVEMGVLFERNVSRTSEQGTVPNLDPDQEPNFFTQTRPVLYEGLVQKDLLEILPAVTYNQDSSRDGGVLTSEPGRMDFGLTGKLGLNSDLVLDAVYNPDFSHVEADVGQVDFNQRYALLYDEKRQFFLEGRELFRFGGSAMSDPLLSVVHTRTIVDPVAGVKLTGKLRQKNTVACLLALDEPDGYPEGERAAVAAVRYKRALDRDSFVGLLGTARELNGSSNRVVGADGQLRTGGPSRIGFHGFLSRSDPGSSAPTNGHALGVNFNYDSRDWHLDTRLRDLSEGFDTEVGYLTRTAITRLTAVAVRYMYPDTATFLRVEPAFVNTAALDKPSRLWERSHALYLGAMFPRSTYVRGGYAYRTEIYRDRRFDTSFSRLFLRSQLTRQVHVSCDYRYGRKVRYVEDPYQGSGHTVVGGVVYQPTDGIRSSLDLTYTDFTRDGDGGREFEYTIVRFGNTYQINRFGFVRAILEYNRFREELMADMLASFTYVPGTVIHLGYGSLYSRTEWDGDRYVDADRFVESRRGLFLKASYLLRM